MARTAKCQICGKQGEVTTMYKKVFGKINKYYCSLSEYEAEEERKRKVAEDKDKVYRLICNIMGVPEIINSALFKEWVEWNKVADNVKIAKYLEENKDYLTSTISRIENKIYNRIRYLSAILKNSLGDYRPKVVNTTVSVQPKVVTVDETIYDTTPTNTRKRRRSLDDLEDEI